MLEADKRITIVVSSPDYERRMDAVRKVSEWELGDAYYGSRLVQAFLDPEDALLMLEREIAATDV